VGARGLGLDGLNLERFTPRVLIIENLFAEKRYHDYMRNRGYAVWRHVEPNAIYVGRSELRAHERVKSLMMRCHHPADTGMPCSTLVCAGPCSENQSAPAYSGMSQRSVMASPCGYSCAVS
jgi:hypothetical protein